jgi:hypothetical protein
MREFEPRAYMMRESKGPAFGVGELRVLTLAVHQESSVLTR